MMTFHYILPCSAKKTIAPDPNLIWSDDTTISEWKIAWNKTSPKLPVSSMYNGYSLTKSLEAIHNSNDDWRVWVVSAGRGLLQGPSSTNKEEEKIPSYDVHCFPKLPMTPQKMRALWEGSENQFYDDRKQNQWTKLDLSAGDCVISALPLSYQSATLPSLDANISTKVDLIGIGNHPRTAPTLRALGTHPRIRETLGCGFSIMRATLLEKWIKGGDGELEKLDSQANSLPFHNTRRRVSDDNLRAIISNAPDDTTSSILGTVRWIRHNQKISASEKRIISALKFCRENPNLE